MQRPNSWMTGGKRYDRRALAAAMIALLLLPLVPCEGAHAQVGPCLGSLSVTPAKVHTGGRITLRGKYFSCKTRTHKVFGRVHVMVYQSGYGYHLFSIPVGKNGSYSLSTTMPRTLTGTAKSRGKTVATRPGTYDFNIQRPVDFYIPLPSQAFARIKVLR